MKPKIIPLEPRTALLRIDSERLRVQHSAPRDLGVITLRGRNWTTEDGRRFVSSIDAARQLVREFYETQGVTPPTSGLIPGAGKSTGPAAPRGGKKSSPAPTSTTPQQQKKETTPSAAASPADIAARELVEKLGGADVLKQILELAAAAPQAGGRGGRGRGRR